MTSLSKDVIFWHSPLGDCISKVIIQSEIITTHTRKKFNIKTQKKQRKKLKNIEFCLTLNIKKTMKYAKF